MSRGNVIERKREKEVNIIDIAIQISLMAKQLKELQEKYSKLEAEYERLWQNIER